MRKFFPILAAVLTLATACQDNNSTSPTVSLNGSWSLRTLNGQSLPVTINGSSTIISETLTLNNDGSYNDVASYSNGSTFNEFGFYSVNNNVITFTDQTDGIVYSGSVSGDVLTEIDGSFTAVYQKN